jgi:hypothetical protein
MAYGDEARVAGIRKAVPYVSIVGVGAPTLIYTLSTGCSAIIRKLMVTNRQAAPILLGIGTWVAGAALALQAYPLFYVINGMDTEWSEDMLPAYVFRTSIYALPSAAGAFPADISCMLEVEEEGA